KNFFENCQYQSTKVAVEYISPDKDFEKYENLVKRFPDSLTGRQGRFGPVDRGILIVYGDLPGDASKKAPHAFLAVSRLVEQQSARTKEDGVKGTLIFKGAPEVRKELSFFAQDRKKRQ